MIALWIYLAYAVSLIHPYWRVLSERAVLRADYIGVFVGTVALAFLWPLHLRKALGQTAFRR